MHAASYVQQYINQFPALFIYDIILMISHTVQSLSSFQYMFITFHLLSVISIIYHLGFFFYFYCALKKNIAMYSHLGNFSDPNLSCMLD